MQKAKASVIFTVQSNRDGREVKSLERRVPSKGSDRRSSRKFASATTSIRALRCLHRSGHDGAGGGS
jgi:hypothetical protein